MPTKYQLFDQFEIDIDRFIYRQRDNYFLEMRVETEDGSKPSRIYLKSPRLQLGPISRYKGNTYLELNLVEEEDTSFREFLQTLDTYHIAQIHANQKIWGHEGEIPLAYFSNNYTTMLKRSTTTYQDCLIINIDEHDRAQFYDKEDQKIALTDLKQGDQVRAILEVSGIETGNLFQEQNGSHNFQTRLTLIQMKAQHID